MHSFLTQKVHTVLALLLIAMTAFATAQIIWHTASEAVDGGYTEWQINDTLPEDH